MENVNAVVFCIAVSGITVFALDIFWQKVHLRPSTGLDFNQKQEANWNRVIVKLIGLIGSVWFIAILYWLFPEYHGGFYFNYWQFLRTIAPVWAAFAVPYFYFVDQRMIEPKDGYWQMGQVLLLNFENLDKKILWQHLLGWLIKGFFLPLMMTYFCRDLERFVQFNFSTIVDFKSFFDFVYDNIFCLMWVLSPLAIFYHLSFLTPKSDHQSPQCSVGPWHFFATSPSGLPSEKTTSIILQTTVGVLGSTTCRFFMKFGDLAF